MINLADIFSLSDFQRRTREHIRRLRRTGRPAVLTVNGRAELVVHDAAAYQRMSDEFDRLRRRAVRASDPAAVDADPVIEAYKRDVDRTLLRENLRRSVEQRVANLAALQRLTQAAQHAGEDER